VFLTKVAQAQLVIEQIDLPEEGTLNQTLQINALVKNEHPASKSGNLKFYLTNQTYPELGVFEFASFEQMQFFASGQGRNFPINLPLSDSHFRIGGNTVVIWPSMVGQENDTIFITKTIYLDEVTITGKTKSDADQIRIFPNPARDIIQIELPDNKDYIYSIMNLEGKVVKEGLMKNRQLNVELLDKGIYLLAIFTINNELLLRRKISIER
jgi:hypothetical protein